ncbi:DUF2303 family protein [Caldimonas sp.]|uniref:DUF2303 family protein n=1 Tax=Caldimonas sp. TaxID=2838790 RepID=UPI00307DEDF3
MSTLDATLTDHTIRSLAELGAALTRPTRNPDPHGTHFVALPPGWGLHDLPTDEVPPHPKAAVKLRDAASFIRYVNDHKEARSRIYATLEPARFLAVLDDFQTSDTAGLAEQADWREFRVEFTVPPSREWQTWTSENRKQMSQLGFAEFLQDQLPDVIAPSGADLLEMSLNFEAAQSGHFVASQRLQDGSHNLTWRADNSGGTVHLPELIKLCIPVFENEAPREIDARLRYRVKDGALTIWFELVRPHKVLEAAFRETWARIEQETQTPILLGTPE